MALSAAIFLFSIFVAFLVYRLLFRENINWSKIFFRTGPTGTDPIAGSCVPSKIGKKLSKFRNTSLYKAALKALNLEEHEAIHCENIGDNFNYFCDLSDAIKTAGLESSNIIIGVDFTASNEWQGRNSLDRKSLHTLFKNKRSNPYQQVITTISVTLEPFDDDNLIPAFGFGDVTTKATSVFPFNKDGFPCKGFERVLERYENIVKTVELSGPTSFVPIIEKAIDIVKESQSYHILVIIADGQVENEEDEATRKALVKASFFPLSIIVVGVGDGPWNNMYTYDKKLPSRLFDNFQFVDYHDCLSKSNKSPELTFALHALMEIPDQYKAIKNLGLIEGNQTCSKKSSRGHNDKT